MFAKRKKKLEAVQRSSKNIGQRVRDLFRNRSADRDVFESLEDLLIEADFGAAAAVEVVDELKKSGSPGMEELKRILKASLVTADLTPPADGLGLYLVLGVNGAGKTTTIAKLGHRFIKDGAGPVVFAAGDTFRAAAVEQLEIHAQRVGARLVKQQQGADPGAVIFDAIDSAQNRGERIVIADTAGRMHNRVNLVKELEKIDRIVKGRLGSGGVYRKILVIDATTGQNGMKQAETFHEAVGVDAVILTKYDSSAKGGLAAAISRRLHLPFAFLGRGEGMDDLTPFQPDDYLNELLASE
ncbi:MAG: signal recognition particle-docking protein FtsY [Spirochaeta sp. LUC14_002_19_P3]|nr:MAG: signal recognition particle-docking protein FtsY [Spirochaeta sp. LUC14_002_19_P3]